MNKIIFIPLLIALFFTVSCSDDSEKTTEKLKPSVCDCAVEGVDENGAKVVNFDNRSKYFNLSFNPAYKISDIYQAFIDLRPSEEELEQHGDSILNYNLFELDSLKYTEDLTISSQLLDKLVFSQSFILNINENNKSETNEEEAGDSQLGFAKAKDTAFVKEYIVNHSEYLVNFDLELKWGLFETSELNDPGYFALYAVKRKKIIGIQDLDHAAKTHDTNTGLTNILLTLKKEGVDKWSEYTEKHTGDFVAIIIHQNVAMAPLIQEPMYGDKIQISGSGKNTINEIEMLTFLINCKVKYLDMRHEEFIQSMEECK